MSCSVAAASSSDAPNGGFRIRILFLVPTREVEVERRAVLERLVGGVGSVSAGQRSSVHSVDDVPVADAKLVKEEPRRMPLSR